MFINKVIIFLYVFVLSFVCICNSNTFADKNIPVVAEDVVPLKVGDSIPNIILKTHDSKDFNLNSAVHKTPAIVIFYRGGW